MPKPHPDLEGITKFVEYRNKGLTYREIEKLMAKPLKTLIRWNNYIRDKKVVVKFSTDKALTA